MESIEINLKTLTPIWTGGIEAGKMDRLHETSLIGSLRWWYEAIIRGLGGNVCNPTSDIAEQRCQFDAEAYEKAKKQNDSKAIEIGLKTVCPVCRLFGCTGWKRRFELQVLATQTEPLWLATKDKPKKFNHWWLSQIYKVNQSKVVVGSLTLSFQWIRGYEDQHILIKALLSLISHLGALGAKPQYGFGIFTFANMFSVNQSLLTIKEKFTQPEIPKNVPGNYLSLSKFWHLQCTVPKTNADALFASVNDIGNKSRNAIFLPVSFDIRYKLPGSPDKGLRQTYRLKHGKMDARQLFGTLEGNEQDKHASNIFVSHLYKTNYSEVDYQLRVWGFTNDEVMGEIQASLKSIFPNLQIRPTVGIQLLTEIRGNR